MIKNIVNNIAIACVLFYSIRQNKNSVGLYNVDITGTCPNAFFVVVCHKFLRLQLFIFITPIVTCGKICSYEFMKREACHVSGKHF